MCVTWSQNDWRAASGREGTRFHVIGEYKDANGQTALMIKTDAGPWTPVQIRNVYSQDGYQEQTFVYGNYDPGTDDYPEHNLDEQLALAKGEMESRGFTPVPEQATAQVDTAGVILVETAMNDLPELVRVQGKTLEEWEEIGKQNENLPEEQHIHPKHPREMGEDRGTTEDEMSAFVNSLTAEEALLGLLATMGGGLSSVFA